MRKAVIDTGGKQYIVSEGQILDIELLGLEENVNKIEFDPLLIINGDEVVVGKPRVEKSKVVAEIVEDRVKGDKVIAIRFKAKKRVRKVKGHRQLSTKIKITSIA